MSEYPRRTPSSAHADPAKGTRNGICNRTACNHTHAIHYNRITERYYCTPCARRLNEVPQGDGIPLCDWPTRDQLGPDHLLLPLSEVATQ